MSTYTYSQIQAAVNAGVEMVMEEIGGERDGELLDLVANASLSLLDNPNLTIDDVLEENYDDPEEVLSWVSS
ncbi:hypothetical protein H9W91_07390 [Streptomyces alfalfae]|uniref:hypothetical protein n=1 Tax=Streptomyces alfalfae TaxID=1642299 RepID=UPI001BA56341|nr:hypothetical protein [Streptomyces alfalfae]QUI30702.1 hypothetical protein H9W91_07390 [Streptomyces alfalfae]